MSLNKVKYKRCLISRFLFAYLLLLSHWAIAAGAPSLGQVSEIMLNPLGAFTGGFYKLCYIIGATLIIGAGMQYKNYRNNPAAVRLSTPVTLLLLGLSLVLLPLIGMLSPASEATSVAVS